MAEDAVAQFPDRLIPYAYALPNYERPVIGELEQAVTERGFRGIKIHAGECTLAEYVVDPVLALAGRCGVPCLIDLGGNLGVAESLAGRFPQTKIIIAHLGRYQCTDEALTERFIDLAANHANIYLDVSGVVLLPKIRNAVLQVGSKRVIWGSDGPAQAPDTATYLKLELAKIRSLELEPQVEQDLLGGSLRALLGI
jgi:predicted TIM-barrel fold metal-dependent hydrolase